MWFDSTYGTNFKNKYIMSEIQQQNKWLIDELSNRDMDAYSQPDVEVRHIPYLRTTVSYIYYDLKIDKTYNFLSKKVKEVRTKI